MIGYYIHHVGRGHLHQAIGVAARLDDEVTGLSSLPRPPEWPGPWVQLPHETAADDDGAPDPRARGALHWAPLHDGGLQGRMALLADWIRMSRPRVLAVDLSVEVTVLARLMGVPVVSFCLPGERSDPAHQLGWRLADAIVAPWPAGYPGMCVGLGPHRARVVHAGAISRFEQRRPIPAGRRRHLLVLGGLGGTNEFGLPDRVEGWSCTVLGAANWCPDPWAQLCAADVVVTHAGLGALSDVAAARRPAVVLPQDRPFNEQHRTAAALAARGTAVVAPTTPRSTAWPQLLDRAVALGGGGWSDWSRGNGARRAAAVIEDVANRLAAREVRTCARQ